MLHIWLTWSTKLGISLDSFLHNNCNITALYFCGLWAWPLCFGKPANQFAVATGIWCTQCPLMGDTGRPFHHVFRFGGLWSFLMDLSDKITACCGTDHPQSFAKWSSTILTSYVVLIRCLYLHVHPCSFKIKLMAYHYILSQYSNICLWKLNKVLSGENVQSKTNGWLYVGCIYLLDPRMCGNVPSAHLNLVISQTATIVWIAMYRHSE